MKPRAKIDEKFKWDLSSYIKNEKEIEEALKLIEKLTEIIPTYNGKLNDK